jgi:predicted RNase H-like HicB family nuclease
LSGYLVVIEGDDTEGYSTYSPDLPGVVAAAATRDDVVTLMREAMAQHIELLREFGEPVPEPTVAAGALVIDPFAASAQAG